MSATDQLQTFSLILARRRLSGGAERHPQISLLGSSNIRTLGPFQGNQMKRLLLTILLPLLACGLLCSPSLADMRITFIDAGQADAALVQIDQPTGEPFTIVVDGGDDDSDLESTLPHNARNSGRPQPVR